MSEQPLLSHTASAKNLGRDSVSSHNLGAAGIPNQLGVSGASSSKRSVVTKTFLAGQQGGFDTYGDADKGIEKSVLSASRPGNVASVISNMMEPEDEEDVHHVFGCWACWKGIPMTNNVKALTVMMFMFAIISIVSMGIDAVSYLGNILGESSDLPSQRIVLQLIFSMLSIFLLLWFNTTTIMESIDGLKGIEDDSEPPAANPDAEGVIVIVFAGLGLTFDAICLYAYWFFAKKDAEVEFEEMKREAELRGSSGDMKVEATIKKPHVNMFSALIHVSADLFRSTSTFVLGILMVSGVLTEDQQNRGDSILAIIISVTIYIAAAIALAEWIGSASSWYNGLGQAIEVVCPEGIEPGDIIRIEPTKGGRGKAADAFMG